MNFLTIFWTTSLPVLRMLILCGLGTLLAQKRFNILPLELQRGMSSLIFWIFGPCLIVAKVALLLTPSDILKWWPLSVSLLFNIAVGYGLGIIIAKLWAPREIQPLILVCCLDEI